MNNVFDMNLLPGRRLSVRKMVALNDLYTVGDAIQIVRQDIVRQLAETILEGPPFFWSREGKSPGFVTLEFGADCIVLTAEEYATLKHKAFRDGVEHAQGFMPARG